MVLLIVAASVMIQVGHTTALQGTTLYWVGMYLNAGLETLFCIIWGITLVKLMRKVKANQRLMPNQLVFVFHWFFLLAFCLTFLLTISAEYRASRVPAD